MTTVTAPTAAHWRAWLAEHAATTKEIWLILHHKDSPTPSVRYAEAVEQALCYGWIDGHHRSNDPHSSRLRFTPRTARSTWSQVNRDRAERMIEEGLMTEAGQAAIDLAKASGTWNPVPNPDTVPDDLRTALDACTPARDHFAAFPPSTKRLIVAWVVGAKRPETRARRIAQTVDLAAIGTRAR
ncbi:MULTISPECIES: YdeI/OmpD-associated family protein [unclassified Saccharothrix]|uniref:YdeI/OmpD-associated family protein n=1 Tax=unclassified Saccharothrix TaxID=2593673 RepID=UPI00307DA79E